MPKRFIEPDWKQLRSLPESLQRAWFYLWDKCDAAGVYTYDPDYLKLDLSLKKALTLNELASLPSCQLISRGRILIKNFLQVNYGTLKENYNPHKPAFRDVLKNGLIVDLSSMQACPKLEDVDEEVEEERDEDVEKGQDQKIEIIMPFDTPDFLSMWEEWKKYKKGQHNFIYKVPASEQSALIKISELSNGIEQTAILIIKESIAQGWKGFFELKNSSNGQQTSNKQPTGANVNAASAFSAIDEMYRNAGNG